MRAWLLKELPEAVEADLSAAQIESAEAIFLCNAVRGILPVRQLGQREWLAHPGVIDLGRRLAAAEPAFAKQES
jgi:4-amino-4-deoxychorismate lyase